MYRNVKVCLSVYLSVTLSRPYCKADLDEIRYGYRSGMDPDLHQGSKIGIFFLLMSKRLTSSIGDKNCIRCLDKKVYNNIQSYVICTVNLSLILYYKLYITSPCVGFVCLLIV